MENTVIKNDVLNYLTVELSNGNRVVDYNFYNNEVTSVTVKNKGTSPFKFRPIEEDKAKAVAQFVSGKVMKHTQTTIITKASEVIE